ncbi:MAG: ABC transporter ATP-binding protein [Planctomycetes bacterium]|nr:ABC transporter ATP-binding protein [Planctomycetota bacterium]MBI3832956.1 ABC transporter ATP-binding protein [Planctomycetota bacterium]
MLDIRDLSVAFHGEHGPLTVVDRVSISVQQGKTIALVGESGCGKSATALAVMRLIPRGVGGIIGGQIHFHDSQSGSSSDLVQLSDARMQRIRGDRIAMIFQEPFTALHPLFTIGSQIVEVIELHRGIRGAAAWRVAVEMLGRVGIVDAAQRAHDYPHQFSGGMRQRAMIAMAIACHPDILIADEPTTALDVTVQAQILDTVLALQRELRMGILLITHDLGVVARVADCVYVMYAGRIVEHARTEMLLSNPQHPYTRGLIACSPSFDHDRGERLQVIPGSVPDPAKFPTGCRFHPRCELSEIRAKNTSRKTTTSNGPPLRITLRRCVESYSGEESGAPALREVSDNHFVSCWEV